MCFTSFRIGCSGFRSNYEQLGMEVYVSALIEEVVEATTKGMEVYVSAIKLIRRSHF